MLAGALLLPALSFAQPAPEVALPPAGGASRALVTTRPAASPAASPADLAAGERLYRLGLRADGSPLQAQRAVVGSTIAGAAAACETCHRRSGMGMQEGRSLVPPVAGPILFRPGQPYRPVRPGRAAPPGSVSSASAPLANPAVSTREPARHLARGAYDLATLARALRDGIDPDGKPLAALMPRYGLSEREVMQLAAYLDTLEPQRATGLAAGVVRLATVLTPDASPERSATVVDTLEHWAKVVRLRGLRPQLQVWQLQGDPPTWRAQLEHWQDTQPVYAVVSGAGRAHWAPVQAFCESRQLPCVLPLVDQVPPPQPGGAAEGPDGDAYFSLYFSGGVAAEAQIAATYLQGLPNPRSSPVSLLQIYLDNDTLGATAARSFGASWPVPEQVTTLKLTAVDESVAGHVRNWLARSRDGHASTTTGDASGPPRPIVLLWLAPQDLLDWARIFPHGMPGVDRVLLSAQLTPVQALGLSPAWQGQLTWASLRSDPMRRQAGQAMAMSNWAARLGLVERPGSEQAEVYAAAFFLGDALARMRLGWSQAYLMEQLEAVVDNRPAGSVYYSLSLGPGQRVAAKVGRMIAVIPAPSAEGSATQPWQNRLAPVSELIRVDD